MNKKSILLVLSILLVFGILVVFFLDIDCIFKSITGIPCPSCGLTRGFRALFHGHIIKAEQYNLLTVPMFLLILSIVFSYIYDLITKSNKLELLLNKLSKNYKLIILIIIINWIINIIRNI